MRGIVSLFLNHDSWLMIWSSLLCLGLSYSTVGLSFFICIYYNVLTSWTLLYFVYSLNSDVPWRDFCSKQLTFPECNSYSQTMESDESQSQINGTSVERRHLNVLQYSGDFEGGFHLNLNLSWNQTGSDGIEITDNTSSRNRTGTGTEWMTEYGLPQQYYFTCVDPIL